MRGKLYGVGVGPGDPDLMTFLAAGTIRKCDVVAAPEAGEGGKAALEIAKRHIEGKKLLMCRFAMENDAEKRYRARLDAADGIARFLDDGKDVAFLTLGDPTTYSTYMYVHEILVSRGYRAGIVPGVTSYSAAAAALGVALCEGDETLTVIPAACGEGIDSLLGLPGNKVVMKAGENLKAVLKALEERGHGDNVKVAYRVSMDGQRLFGSLSEYEKSPENGYFTITIVKEGSKAYGSE